MPEEYRFNKAISLDVFVSKDANGRKYKVMSVVDLGTLFHVAVIVGEGAGPPASSDMAKALSTCWFSWAGTPESVVLDRGLENRGKLQELVRSHGILLRYIGVESAHQLGRGERQGGILKDIMKTTILSRQLRWRQNMEFVVTEAVGVKNHRINHHGFSPAQWVLGRNPPEIDALTTLDSSAKLGVHQEILDGETSFAQQMVIRGAAREAFAQSDSSRRIRSKHAEPRTLPHGRPGVLPQEAGLQQTLEVARPCPCDRTRRTWNFVGCPRRDPLDCIRGTMPSCNRQRDARQESLGATSLSKA